MPTKQAAGAYHHGDLRRALIDAAKAIVAEEQNWEFSLREVARRAGVSHNAPYRHFPEKLDLLAAVAADGFRELQTAMEGASVVEQTPESALLAIGDAYADFGVANPARYRLMFGTALGPTRSGLPAVVGEAAAKSKRVLSHILEAGVAQDRFAAPEANPGDAAFLTLAAWSVMHGMTMLLIDGLSETPPSSGLFRQMGLALLQGIKHH